MTTDEATPEQTPPNPYRVGRGECHKCHSSGATDEIEHAGPCDTCHGTCLGPSLAERMGWSDELTIDQCMNKAVYEVVLFNGTRQQWEKCFDPLQSKDHQVIANIALEALKNKK